MFAEIWEWIEPSIIEILGILLIAISCYFGIKKGIRYVHYSKMQTKSVISRGRNAFTKKMYQDLFDIRLLGIFPVGHKLEDLLWEFMPRAMEELEDQRVRNPMVWRETIKYITPVLLYIKVMAKYKPQDAIKYVFSFITQFAQEVAPEPVQDPEGQDQSDPGDNIQR